MAKLDGIIKIQGTLENLTFYKSVDGYKVRTKGGVSRQRILNDPAFARTRENGLEFGQSAASGKMLRTAIGSMVFKAKDARLSSRLLKLMSEIKNHDVVSVRGSRNVGQGINTVMGSRALKGFDFNQSAMLNAVLHAPFAVTAATGKVVITDLIPKEDLLFPIGATHFSVQSAYLNLDFSTGISAITFSPVITLPLSLVAATQTLTPTAVPAGVGKKIYLLLVSFHQEVNSVQYALNNGGYNVLNVLDVV